MDIWGVTNTQGEDRRARIVALLVMVGVSGSLRTSPHAPPPPGTGVTSSPFDPLWGLAPPTFFSVDTNGTGLADASPKDFRKTLMSTLVFSTQDISFHSNVSAVSSPGLLVYFNPSYLYHIPTVLEYYTKPMLSL